MRYLFSKFAKILICLQNSVRTLKSGAVEDSHIYLRSMLRHPPAVSPLSLPRNSCSFIGTVIRPIKRYGSDRFNRAYTVLEVNTASRNSDLSPYSFKILLDMQDKLSEISMRHLKPNDYVYVCGSLRSYEKVNASGKHETFYKVIVAELNFVKRKDTDQISQKPEGVDANLTVSTSCESDIEKVSFGVSDNEKEKRDRLRLWQVFFASPHEWWDNRRNKGNPRMPDFKHKDTKECLWLRLDDPPWVRKQLQLYDSSMGGAPACYSRSNELGWELDDCVAMDSYDYHYHRGKA